MEIGQINILRNIGNNEDVLTFAIQKIARK